MMAKDNITVNSDQVKELPGLPEKEGESIHQKKNGSLVPTSHEVVTEVIQEQHDLTTEKPTTAKHVTSSAPCTCSKALSKDHMKLQPPYWFARFYARFFWLVTIISGIVGTACIFLCVFKIPFPNFDDPTEGFSARHTHISLRSRTLLRMNRFDDFLKMPNRSLFPPPARERRDLSEPVTSKPGKTFNVPACKALKVEKKRIKLVFESNTANSDLFNLRSFHSICDIETLVVRPTLPAQLRPPCHHMVSLPILTAAHANKVCGHLTEADITSMKNLLADCYPYYKGKEMSSDAPGKCTENNMVHTILYYLTDVGFKPSRNASSKLTYTNMVYTVDPEGPNKQYFQTYFEGKHIEHGSVKLVSFYSSVNDKFSIFNDYLLSDLLFLIGILACVLIFVILLFYLFSVVLAIATFINVVFSFATAYVIYYYVFGITFFPFINILAALILVAVGADDVFIFWDAWKQAKKDDAYIPLQNRVGRAFGHAAISIAVTSLTTSASFFANYVTKIVCIKCFAIFAGLAVLANFIFMITWTPSIIIFIHVVQKWFVSRVMRAVFGHNYDKFAYNADKFFRAKNNVFRPIFNKVLPKMIEKAWFIWIPLLLSLGIGGMVTVLYYPKLQLPKSKEFQLFPSKQLMEVWDQKTRMEFQFEKDSDDRHEIDLYFVWGLIPSDTGKWFSENDLGDLVFDKNFDFFSAKTQKFLKQFGDNLLNSDIIDAPKEMKESHLSYFELMQEVLGHCEIKSGGAPLFDPYRTMCCKERKVPFSREYLHQCAGVLGYGVGIYIPPNKILGRPIYDHANNIMGFVIKISSNMYFTTSYEEMDVFYSKLDRFVEDQNKIAPEGFNGLFVSGQYEFLFYALQKAIASGTFTSVGLSLIAAAILMLLTSLNLLLTVYAMVTITLAISVTVGCFVLLGWHLNIVESITLSLAVGLSIDFTIHYGVSYRLSKEKHRADRTRESFSRVGSAIVMAALTTFVAGAAMMPTKIMPYLQLGTFLMVVMTFSWVYATFFFMSLCHKIGPNGNFCQVPLPKCKKRGTRSEEDTDESNYRADFVSDPTLPLDSLDHNLSPSDDFMISA